VPSGVHSGERARSDPNGQNWRLALVGFLGAIASGGILEGARRLEALDTCIHDDTDMDTPSPSREIKETLAAKNNQGLSGCHELS